jgi:tRNA A-37 threonylcarbamoyl transferase component Bud32
LSNRIKLNKEDQEAFEELKIYKLYNDEDIDRLIARQRELMELRNSRIAE